MNAASYFSVSPFGLTSVTALGSTKLRAGRQTSADVERFSYSWFPPRFLTRYLYDRFSLQFDCYQAADGTRRFAPAGGLEAFLHPAFLAGLAIRLHEQEITFDTWKLNAKQHHVFQKVRRMHAHLARRFDSSHDLHVRARGRGGDIGVRLLPDDLVFDRSQHGPASVELVMRHGRELAMAEGISEPTERTMIHYGLFEAAQLNPRRVPNGQTSALFRLALFDVTAGDIPSRDVIRIVRQRVLRWIDDHCGQSVVQFDLGFFSAKSNFIKAIADQRNSSGGELEHDLVRHSMLQLGWESYGLIARCIETYMRWFMRSLPEPLTGSERSLFQEMYFRRPYFGNLSLALFKERGGFIQKAVTELWEDPGAERHIGTLHRLLEIYGQLIVKRREADRRSKQKSGSTSSAGLEVNGQNFEKLEAAAPRTTSPIFNGIAEALAERNGMQCKRCGGRWESRLAEELPDGGLPDPIVLTVNCSCHRTMTTLALDLKEFETLAEQMMRSI